MVQAETDISSIPQIGTETRESRRKRVEDLFKRIAFLAEVYKNDIKTRDKLHKPLAEELWTISQKQLLLGELDHLK